MRSFSWFSESKGRFTSISNISSALVLVCCCSEHISDV